MFKETSYLSPTQTWNVSLSLLSSSFSHLSISLSLSLTFYNNRDHASAEIWDFWKEEKG